MSSSIAEKFKAYEKQVDRILGQYPIVLQFERQTGINKVHGVVLAVLLLFGLIAYRLAPQTFSTIALFAYPAYHTAAAIERHDKAADVHWMSYWLALGAIAFIEGLVSAEWLAKRIPLYLPLKLALAVWMYAPRFRGSLVVFERGLGPLFAQLRFSVELVQKSLGGSAKPTSAVATGMTKLGLAKSAAASSASALKKPASAAASSSSGSTSPLAASAENTDSPKHD